MKVIGAGYGRTGTLSLKAALERLGFGPCYHMVELMRHPEHGPLWRSALGGETVDWRDVFSGYEATTDWPACNFWRELADAYPEAKVILTLRDPERWWNSIDSTVFAAMRAGVTPGPPPAVLEMQRLAELLMTTTFAGRVADREHVVRQFEEHNERVRQGVPASRLLVYQVSQGWGPLCDFLGVEPPGEPFPHLNEGAHFPALVRDLSDGASDANGEDRRSE
jgi:Sulfotransferase domain